MDSSILNTIKKLIGLDVDYTPFDEDIKVFINGAMMVLQQLGVGPLKGFAVSDFTQTWSDFLPSDIMLDGVKQYIYLYVKMAFDPPASSVVMEAMKAQKSELEWRLREQAEFYPGDGSRLGYWESQEEAVVDDADGLKTAVAEAVTAAMNGETIRYRMRRNTAGKPPDDVTDGFRVHGGRYASDSDYPWTDGPGQPAIAESGDDS